MENTIIILADNFWETHTVKEETEHDTLKMPH